MDHIRRIFRSRYARWIVLGAILFLVVRVASGLPSTVEIEYHLGQAREGLQRAEMRYLSEGEEVRRVAFSYVGKPAKAIQIHEAQLLDGDYTVRLSLSYGGGKERRLDRPLIVRGSGRVSIYLESPEEGT
jgi:hypothetical protein